MHKNSTFDQNFINDRKHDLEKRRDEILRELDDAAVRISDNDYSAKFTDFGDKEDENAAEVADFEKNLSLEKTLEVSLFNVRKALEKIEGGNYGLCEHCGQPIDPKRLEAFPSANSCMDCKRRSL